MLYESIRNAIIKKTRYLTTTTPKPLFPTWYKDNKIQRTSTTTITRMVPKSIVITIEYRHHNLTTTHHRRQSTSTRHHPKQYLPTITIYIINTISFI